MVILVYFSSHSPNKIQIECVSTKISRKFRYANYFKNVASKSIVVYSFFARAKIVMLSLKYEWPIRSEISRHAIILRRRHAISFHSRMGTSKVFVIFSSTSSSCSSSSSSTFFWSNIGIVDLSNIWPDNISESWIPN